jgi:hypothetical protein
MLSMVCPPPSARLRETHQLEHQVKFLSDEQASPAIMLVGGHVRPRTSQTLGHGNRQGLSTLFPVTGSSLPVIY